MQDYIPKEELAKFLASSGSAEAKAQAEALEAAQRIQSDNIGHKLLSQMGWKEGQGLGAEGVGVAAPVAATGAVGYEKAGLGAQDHRSVAEGDDEFETYRKRMMLGYKHRCNPPSHFPFHIFYPPLPSGASYPPHWHSLSPWYWLGLALPPPPSPPSFLLPVFGSFKPCSVDLRDKMSLLAGCGTLAAITD